VVVGTFHQAHQNLPTVQATPYSAHLVETSTEPSSMGRLLFRHRLEPETGLQDVANASRSAAQAM